MSLFGDLNFYVYLCIIVLPAIPLGLVGKSAKYYGLIATGLTIYLSYNDGSLPSLALYALYSIALIQTFFRIHQKKNWLLATIFVLLAILPLVMVKLQLSVGGLSFGFLGISYVTFRVVQIILETYDGLIETISLSDLAYFLLFFPSISSGPIDKSRRFVNEIHAERSRAEYISIMGDGFFKISLGLLYKFLIADALFTFFNLYKGIPGSNVLLGDYGSWLTALDPLYRTLASGTLLGTFLFYAGYALIYGLYLFFDFAGYSNLAVGTGHLFGVRLPDNFNQPFKATSMKDFWNRWHMSLSYWFRDFIFSRLTLLFMKKKVFSSRITLAFVAYLINMTIMGVWHGFEIHYVLYGIYHGLLLGLNEIYEKKSTFYKKYKKERWYMGLSWAVTMGMVFFGFLLFSGGLNHLLKI